MESRTLRRSGMRIARDGTWYHQGAPIGRPAMVRLFSTILRREPDGRHVLVTPVEKLDIEVEGRAFRAVEMKSEGEGRDQRIAFALNSGDAVVAGPDHPLRIARDDRRAVASPARPPRARGRAVAAGLLRAGRAGARRAATSRRACGATAPSSRWSRPHDARRAAARGALATAARAAARRRPCPSFAPRRRLPAAVLVAVIDRAEPGVILTVRREHLRTHAGQIGFPGGRIDPGEDADRRRAARGAGGNPARPAAVEMIGDDRALPHRHRLSTSRRCSASCRPTCRSSRTSRGRRLVRGAARLSCSIPPTSAAEARCSRGATRHYYEIMWNGRRIWGATAAMIVNLSRRLQWR